MRVPRVNLHAQGVLWVKPYRTYPAKRNHKLTKIYTCLLMLTVAALSAQDKKANVETKEVSELRLKGVPLRASIAALAKAPIPLEANLASLTVYDVWTNVAVAPGERTILTSQSDYTGANSTAVTLLCGSNVKDVVVLMFWSNPVAKFYIGTTAILGSNLLFSNGGGSVVPAFGNQLQIEVRNTGTTPIACDQVASYAVVH